MYFSKKGDTTLIKELVYLVIGILGLYIVIFVAGPKLMGVISNAPDKASVNNYDRLVSEVSLFLDEYHSWEKENTLVVNLGSSREIPLNIDPKLGIKFYSFDEVKPLKCKKDFFCVCIAYIEEFTASQGKKPYKCHSFSNGANFKFENTDVSDLKSGLIQGSGFQSYVLSINNYNTFDVIVKTIVKEGTSAYMSFETFCGNEDYCKKTYLSGSSDSPLGSPFGDGNTIKITSGYKTNGYSEYIKNHPELGLSQAYINGGHQGIDIVPSESYKRTNYIYKNKNKPVFFAVCNGYAKGELNVVNGHRIYLTCKDGHVVLYLHNEYNFISDRVEVKYGQPLGVMGNTGKSTGAHIHFQINKGAVVNPLKFVSKNNFESYDDDEIRCQVNQCSYEEGKVMDDSCVSCCYPEKCDFSFCPTVKKTCSIDNTIPINTVIPRGAIE